jgi:hypothetical protein
MSTRRAVLAAVGVVSVLSCGGGPPPATLAGTWAGKQAVSVRVRDPRGGYRFPTDTVAISLTIGPGGRTAGYAGAAILESAYVLRNRGWLGRRLHIASDFQLSGRLQGVIFAGDPLPTVDVSAAFNVSGDTLEGTLFQRVAMGAVPMVNLRLVRR